MEIIVMKYKNLCKSIQQRNSPFTLNRRKITINYQLVTNIKNETLILYRKPKVDGKDWEKVPVQVFEDIQKEFVAQGKMRFIKDSDVMLNMLLAMAGAHENIDL